MDRTMRWSRGGIGRSVEFFNPITHRCDDYERRFHLQKPQSRPNYRNHVITMLLDGARVL